MGGEEHGAARRRPRRNTFVWVGGVWILGLFVLASLFLLREREDRFEHAPVVVAGLHEQVAEISGLVFDATPGHTNGPREVRRELHREEARFNGSLVELEGVDPAGGRRLDSADDRFFHTIWQMFALVVAGRPGDAGAIAGKADSPRGSISQLQSALDAEDAALDRKAARVRLATNAGTVAVVVLALLAFSVALYRATRARRRAESLADLNERLLLISQTESRRYRELFENANEPIATVDLDWTVTSINKAFAEALGYTREEMLGSNLSECLTQEGQELSRYYMEQKLGRHTVSSTYEQTFLAKDGRHVIFEVSTRLIEEDGRPVGIQGMCRDITARKVAESRLRELADLNRYQAHHDALTGLPNRLHFHDEIERAIADGRRTGPFAVALIDLDRFKEINDTLGHRAGDVLLQKLAAQLTRVVEPPHALARLGGDEFGVLLHGLTDTHGAWAETVDRIKAALEQPMLVEGIPVSIEASVGIAIHPTHGDGVDALLQRADVAMYVAKTTGRGHAVYTAREDRNDAGKLALLGELRRALTERELVLHYQPILDRRRGGAPTVEALVRWQHPTHGLVAPAEFLPLAERTGLIKPLTLYVFDEAVRQCKEWELAGRSIDVSVNLSTRNLSEHDLVENLTRIFAQRELDPSRVMLEITESAIIVDPISTMRVLDRLATAGLRVAIDDFGAGYTSLSHLAHLPIDQIKIDRSFVAGLLEDSQERAIVRSIIALSHDLGLEVVAEGVETQDVLDGLLELRCDRLQGYYFTRPLDSEKLVSWLDEERGLPGSAQAA
jgi:diguanylate cyclase (GGDEF)-like protein/PAS domain S-box-containing protein